MSREIKFRAWNVKTKEYNRYVEIYCYKDGSTGLSAGINNNNPVGNSENFILEQFTGVIDKNGVDIYEGDTLKHNKNIFFVRYSKNQHVLLLRDINEKSKSWRSLEWCDNVKNYIEVIGSIHENKN